MSSASTNYATLAPNGLLPNEQTRAGLAEGLATLNASGVVPASQLGDERQSFEAINEAGSTLDLVFVTYASWDLGALPAGTYRVEYWANAACADAGNEAVDVRFYLENSGAAQTDITLNARQNFERLSHQHPAPASGSTDHGLASGWREVAIGAETYTIEVEFRRVNVGGGGPADTVYCLGARATIERVA